MTIREFVTSDRYTGFTKAGVRILSADFPDFKKMINSVTDEDMKQEESAEGGVSKAPKAPKGKKEKDQKDQKELDEEFDY